MHPHVSFEHYNPHSKSHSYQQQPTHPQQKNPSSPIYNTRNNYHYNYSPSHNPNQKPLNNSAQEPFSRPREKAQYQRPQSNKDKRDNCVINSRNQESYKHQNNSRPLIQTSNQNYSTHFSSSLFPNTSKLLDLYKFVQENVNLRKKLLQQLEKIKQKNIQSKNIINQQQQKTKSSTRDTTPKRNSRDKASNLFEKKQTPQNATQQPFTQEQQLTHLLQLKHQKQQHLQKQKQTLQALQKTNTQKRQHLHKLQSQNLNQSIHETPLLRQKQHAIEYLSIEIEWMNEKSTQLKRLVNNKNDQENVFEMYEKMCRQVETLRKENNKKSQRLKKLFEKTNQLTNKQENVNMFLMNLKV